MFEERTAGCYLGQICHSLVLMMLVSPKMVQGLSSVGEHYPTTSRTQTHFHQSKKIHPNSLQWWWWFIIMIQSIQKTGDHDVLMLPVKWIEENGGTSKYTDWIKNHEFIRIITILTVFFSNVPQMEKYLLTIWCDHTLYQRNLSLFTEQFGLTDFFLWPWVRETSRFIFQQHIWSHQPWHEVYTTNQPNAVYPDIYTVSDHVIQSYNKIFISQFHCRNDIKVQRGTKE